MLAECDCSLQVKWIPYCTKSGNACASLTWTVRLLCLARETEQMNLPLSDSSGPIFALLHQGHCCLRERTRLQRLTCRRLLSSWAPKCPIGEPIFMARSAILCCYPTASAQPVGLDKMLFFCRLSTCCAMPVLAQSSSSVSCHGGARFLECWVLRCPWVHKLAGCASLQWLFKCIRSSKLSVHTSLITIFH